MTTHAVTGQIVRCPHCGKANRVRPVARGIPRCGSCHRPLPWLVEADADRFEEEIHASVPVLVDLWAPWCGPCHNMAPVLENIAKERAADLKIVKLDVDRAPQTAARFGVQGVPTLVLLRDGEEVGRLVGAVPPQRLDAWLDGVLGHTDSS